MDRTSVHIFTKWAVQMTSVLPIHPFIKAKNDEADITYIGLVANLVGNQKAGMFISISA